MATFLVSEQACQWHDWQWHLRNAEYLHGRPTIEFLFHSFATDQRSLKASRESFQKLLSHLEVDKRKEIYSNWTRDYLTNFLSPALLYLQLRWQKSARILSCTLRQSNWNFTHQVRASISREFSSLSGVICHSGLLLKCIKNSPSQIRLHNDCLVGGGLLHEFFFLLRRLLCILILKELPHSVFLNYWLCPCGLTVMLPLPKLVHPFRSSATSIWMCW